MRSVIEPGEVLAAQQVEVATIESTGDYGRIFSYPLGAAGPKVQLSTTAM